MRQLSLFAWLLALPIVAEALQVQVENAQVREKPSYMGKVIGTLPYGTEITPASTQGAWTQVKLTNGQFAWINSSALTSKRITIRANGAAVNQTASASDLALAGKEAQHVAGRFRQNAPHRPGHLGGNRRNAFHQQVPRLYRIHTRLCGVDVRVA